MKRLLIRLRRRRKVAPVQDNLGDLRAVRAVFAPHEDRLWSSTILDRLAAANPKLDGAWSVDHVQDRMYRVGLSEQPIVIGNRSRPGYLRRDIDRVLSGVGR
ncbi:hypothetical protein [Sphaerisporangium sp. NPDC051011]|uniref:hypothetical protein n=1 Tax=Sphaerisporangium sp. NPDC051011 TaxID=3155792 RepID=UPI0033C71093